MSSSSPRWRRRLAARLLQGCIVIGLTACGEPSGPAARDLRLMVIAYPWQAADPAARDTLMVLDPDAGWARTRSAAMPLAVSEVEISAPAGRIAVQSGRNRIAVLDFGLRIVHDVPRPDYVWGVALSPDGSRILHGDVATHELRVVEVMSGRTSAVPGVRSGYYFMPAWSPTGARIAFEGQRGDGNPEAGILVGNLDGSGVREVDPAVAGVKSQSAGDPAWSPDGRQLVYWRDLVFPDGRRENGLVIVSLETGTVRQLTLRSSSGRGSDFWPSWSPDGTRIAFVRTSSPAPGQDYVDVDVFVINADGSGLEQVTRTPQVLERRPGWGWF